MSISFIFWFFMLCWVAFAIWRDSGDRYMLGRHALLFVLFFLLGWQVFGWPIRG